MSYKEFIDTLNLFGYKYSTYESNDMNFVSWVLTPINRDDDIEKVSIGYVVYFDEVTQESVQASEKVNMQKHFSGSHTKGSKGLFGDYTYSECINELIELNLLSKEALRHHKLKQLGI